MKPKQRNPVPYGMSMTGYLNMMFPTDEELPQTDNEVRIGKIKGKKLSLTAKQGKRKLDCRIVRDYFKCDSTYYEDGSLKIHTRVDDILHGVAGLDDGSEKPLNKVTILELIAPCEYLTVPDIIDYCGISERQAQKYFNACVIAVRAIEREIKIGTI